MSLPFLIIALLISTIGGLLFKFLKFPAGLLVGGIVAVSIFNILSGSVIAPPYLTIILQIVSGTLIGSSFTKKDILDIRSLLFPAILLIGGMVVTNLLVGSIIALVSPLDLLSSLMGTIPGGVTESVIMADQLGADVASVALMQLSRLLLSLLIFPSFIHYVLRHEESFKEDASSRGEGKVITSRLKRIIYTVIVGTTAGFAGSFIPFIPVPAMLCSLVATSIANIFITPTLFPIQFRQGAQIAAGVLVGSRVTMGTITGLKELIVPVLIMFLGFLIIHSLLAILVSKVTGMNKGITLFSSIPAGASDIALVASEMNYSSPVIALFQMLRLISCITIFPLVIKIFVMIVS